MSKDLYAGKRASSWTRLIMPGPAAASSDQGSRSPGRSGFIYEYLHSLSLFRNGSKVTEGLLARLHFKMPGEIVGDQVEEWSFTGRVAQVESLGRNNGKSGVGVQFLFYEVPPPALK